MFNQKIKSLIFFIFISTLIFYFFNSFAREGNIVERSTNSYSGNFLGLIDVLNNIVFDFEFINSINREDVLTTSFSSVGVPREYSRVNPFSYSSSRGFSNTPTTPPPSIGDQPIQEVPIQEVPVTTPTSTPTPASAQAEVETNTPDSQSTGSINIQNTPNQ